MKKLMMTTALVAMTSMGAVAQTTTAPATGNEAPAATQTVPGFVVSNFTGKNLYAFDNEEAREIAEDQAAGNDAARWENSEMFNENRDAWEDVGSISDVVMTNDGDVRGILIDVGGFLGLGARTVMVDFEQLNFVADANAAEDLSNFVVVATLNREELEALPEWDEAQLEQGYEARSTGGIAPMNDDAQMNNDAQMNDGETGSMTTATAPEGYSDMPEQERTAERLIGANVTSAEGEEIAQVEDLVLDTDGAASHVVMDVGGFLGMGTHTVAIDIDDVDLLWNDTDEDVMVRVSMTEDELRELPAHEG